jgi:hypothetical protein
VVSLKLFKITKTAQEFMIAHVSERQDIYDNICSLAHKVRPYRESDGIRRIAPGFFKYMTKKYSFDFELTDDGQIIIAKISRNEAGK